MPLRFRSRAAGLLMVGALIAIAAGAFAVGAGAGQSSGPAGATRTGNPARRHTATTRASAKDSFTGSIHAGTGRYAHTSGIVSIYLHVKSGHAQTRIGKVTVHGRRCGPAGACRALRGVLRGTLTGAAGGLPDTGKSFELRARGHVVPLGTVTARGTVRGTGFIRQGRESLMMTLTTAHGRLSIDASSEPVRGFTSP